MIASVLVLLDYSFSLLRKSVFGRYLLGRCSSSLQSSPYRFELPVLEADAVIEPESGIRFRPPVYIQRYTLIARIFEQKKLLGGCKKIVDFGCAEIALFTYIKQTEGVEEYIAVDIDEELLNRYSCRVLPLTCDYLADRTHPFNVKVLCGSVADPDVRLFGTDIVVAIELIEHLYPEPLEELPYNIFGVIQPEVAVFTTPNSDFNVLFNDLIGFRHDDHKFEWSREQFKDWADNLVVRYPNYEVEVNGIGPGPPGSEHLGCSTQIAIFFRKGPRNKIEDVFYKETYKLIRNVDYPFTDPQVLFEGHVTYYADSFIRLSINSEKYLNDDDQEHRIPFCDIVDHVIAKVPTCSKDQVKPLLKDSWKIVEDETGALTVVVPYDGPEDDWSISSQATSTDRSLVTDLEDYRLNACAADESDWDAEPDNESLTLHLNETEMNEEEGYPASTSQDGIPSGVADLQVPMIASLVPEVCPLKPPEVEGSSGPVINNINRGNPNGVVSLPKCHSLEQINPSRNKSFRFSLNMEKNDPFSCDISSANSETNRDKSVPSFSESFGLRLEDSCSQSKAADSGYPNSFGQDMDMDLTPEQVDEIITETESSFDGDDESISGDEMDGPEQQQLLNREMGNAPPLLRFLDNVENGDVANNNRDGEGNNMEDNNRDIGEVLEFVQDVIQAEGDLQHLNMAEGRAPQYPDESDEEAISNTVDGSSQADSTLPMLDDDTIQRCLADRGIAVVMGDAPSVSSGPSLPITPSNTRNPSVDDLIEDGISLNEFPSWLCNILLDDDDELGGGDTDTLDGLRGDGVTSDEDIVREDLDAESSIDHLIPGDVQGGGEPSTR
uniref:Small RNA 2'-O-methyltransferase n=1 Tax=Lygus hesperus TaxID=30085 RepID=A0A0A9Y9Z0_LYGHE